MPITLKEILKRINEEKLDVYEAFRYTPYTITKDLRVHDRKRRLVTTLILEDGIYKIT